MDPRLKSLAIVLVGAAVGAVVAGGAISYVNASATPETPLSRGGSDYASSNTADATPAENGPPSENIAPNDGSSTIDVPANTPSQDRDVAPGDSSSRSGDDGPSTTVTTDVNSAITPAKKSQPKKKPAPVVEEEGDAPKASEDGKDGGLRDGDDAKDSDGGTVR